MRYFRVLFATLIGLGLLPGVAILSSSCTATGEPTPFIKRLLPVLEAFGDAAIQLHVSPLVRDRAPAVFAMLDASPADGVLSLAELRAATVTDTAFAIALLVALERLVLDEDAKRARVPAPLIPASGIR